jgi:hypothetical protein
MAMDKLLSRLKVSYPHLKYVPGKDFCWSPETGEIIYGANSSNNNAVYSLLHETAHALLNHKSYKSDFSLLKLELEAWQKAQEIAQDFGMIISKDHVENCLDTYRDWLYRRSICPNCAVQCLQQSDLVHYRCFNCHTTWRVSANRFCRAYRSTKNVPQHTNFHLATDLK